MNERDQKEIFKENTMTQVLGGPVSTQFTYRPDETSFAMAINTVREDQEAMCGYKLILLKERSVEQADAKGRFVEVFVTFEPYPDSVGEPVAPTPTPLDATK